MVPSVSVVIPSLNAPTLPDTLAALYRQRCADAIAEIIVVGRDDQGLLRSHPRLRFVETPVPLSPAAARNLGAAMSSGDPIVFVDADVQPLPDTLSLLTDALKESEVAGGSIILESGDYWRLVRNIMSFSFCTEEMPREYRDHLPSFLMAVRRETWLACGGFDEGYPHAAGEDVDWGIRASRYGFRQLFAPCALAYHRPMQVDGVTAMRKMRQYGAAWWRSYVLALRGRADTPGYTPRSRIEYLLGLLAAGRRRAIAAPWLLAWAWSWIVSALLRDVLLIYLRRPAVQRFPQALPGLLLLYLAWYHGLLEMLWEQ
jgi:GT2 family glycosyltransferase